MAEFDGHFNGGATTKRQRRPSVRLGDLGGDPPLLQSQWKQQKGLRGKSSETLEKDCNGGDMDLDRVAIGSWKSKSAKIGGSVRKRVRSNWVSSMLSADGDGEEEVGRDFRREDSYEEDERNGTPGNSFDDYEDVERGGLFSRGEMDGPSDSGERNGVKGWLNELGLGRYAPVFEIHEVDEEVLPMLTLEDLKDMGINAVGTRRKMFSSIQKMNRGLS